MILHSSMVAIEVLHYCLMWGESTSNWWIPPTMGQWCRGFWLPICLCLLDWVSLMIEYDTAWCHEYPITWGNFISPSLDYTRCIPISHGNGKCILWNEKAPFIPGESIVPLIKSPRYTGGDFMFLYRFVRRRRRRRRPQILVHAITFEQLFGFLPFLARLLALTYRLTD